MAASMTAMATVVWSDLAEASVLAPQVELADEVPSPSPVKLRKVEHHEDALLDDLRLELGQKPQPGSRKRVRFGNFEGY